MEYHNNTLIGNSSTSAGGGAGTYIEMESGTINFSGNIHTSNTSAWQGGALWISNNGGTINMSDNTFTNNVSGQAGGAANIFLDNGVATLDHNVFNENEAGEAGGGICLSTTTGTLNIFNNTFYGNTGADGGDVYLYFDNASSSANFYNNILYNSSLPALSFSGEQTVVATYSDIEGGTGQPWFGTGCIDSDPLFADPAGGDFNLTWANFPVPDSTRSPCIDAGDPASPLDPDSTVTDMGAFYFDQTSGIEDNYSGYTKSYFRLYQNYPNPFNSSTTIRYSLCKPSCVTIHIYNISGQLVKTLANDYKVVGDYAIVWDAKGIRSGIYLCQLKTNGFQATKKLELIR